MRSSYSKDDVTILLKDITGMVKPQPTQEREKLIQSGRHYSEMLPIEYVPTQKYMEVYEQALLQYAKPVANAVGVLVDKIMQKRGKSVVLVSLARAGIPVGILLKRYIRYKYKQDVPHYAVSIIRGRGIDKNAMNYLLERYEPSRLLFVDGWIGKGAILRELEKDLDEYEGVSKELAVLADPANASDLCGTHEDILIPSSCLNNTVSGLISRTFLRSDIIGEKDFHGAVYYEELKDSDLSYEFIRTIEQEFCMENEEKQEKIPGTGMDEVIEIAKHFDIGDINLIKPGVGEATRVLLRRVPWKILIDERYQEDAQLGHLLRLAEEKMQGQKESALKDAEAEKAALEQQEKQLRTNILDCIRMSGRKENQETEEEMSVLFSMLQNIYAEAENRKVSSVRKIKSLEKEYQVLVQAEQELEQCRGMRLDEIREMRKNLTEKKQKKEQQITECRVLSEALGTLSYECWEYAEQEGKQAEVQAEIMEQTFKTSEKQKQVLEREITSIRSVLEMLEDGRQTQNREETELGNRLQEIMQSSVFASEEEMCGYAVSEEKIAREEQQINDYRLRVRTNEVQLEQAQKEAEGKEYIDAEKLQREVCVQEANREELYRKENEIVFRIKNNQEKKKNIESRRAELEQAKKEYLVCTRLYQLVRGQTGNGKITLEQYVQAAGFDRIILAANKRLLPMSDGQYELYRQQDNAGRRSNTFLDLEVLDHYTGHRRPVGNLSGGESFKASLSLALGLSDSISSSLGGIQMDALFVDEGFGTLDRKSMENAMEILTHLSEKNKLVGIISHREELVENIPQQIRVKKTREGSRIEVESEY